MKKKERIEVKIKGMEVLDFSLSTPRNNLSNSELFQFEVKVEHDFKKENSWVFVICTVKIFNEAKENLYSQIQTSCIYEVQNISSMINKKTKLFELPKDLIEAINSASISTTRGVMFSNLKGTFLHNAILPLIQT